MGYATSAPKNKLQQTLHQTSKEAGDPADEQERISYGIITNVNEESSQVKVKFLNSDGTAGEEIAAGYLPLINSLAEIHLLYGSLRTGLVARIYWKGKLTPAQRPLIEIIGDEESSFLQKNPELNEVNTGPYKIFGGGVGY